MENKRRLSRPLMVGHRSHGRCRYDPEVKRELGEAYLQPGVSAALMALEHGINANLMHKWINRHCENVSPAQYPSHTIGLCTGAVNGGTEVSRQHRPHHSSQHGFGE
ncbi:transposase [Methylomonas sp. LWB]|uniref:transposase n=1 Tax=Methylomonas sp. LWB TaxID=1905845 RepID=UPI0011150A46|nr:transposase [Methylomonas sp. LWB]